MSTSLQWITKIGDLWHNGQFIPVRVLRGHNKHKENHKNDKADTLSLF